MDSHAGRFREKNDPKIESWMQRIGLGEVVEIKGEEFEVAGVTERYLTLKLLSAEERQKKALDEIAANRDRGVTRDGGSIG